MGVAGGALGLCFLGIVLGKCTGGFQGPVTPILDPQISPIFQTSFFIRPNFMTTASIW